MRERGSGHIVNVSTIGLQTNTPRFSAYVASKAALDAFSRSIAPEIIDDGVHITTVYMPLVRTPMIAPTKIYDRFPTLSPEEAGAHDRRGDSQAAQADRDHAGQHRAAQLRDRSQARRTCVVNRAYNLFPEGDGEAPRSHPTARAPNSVRSHAPPAAFTGNRSLDTQARRRAAAVRPARPAVPASRDRRGACAAAAARRRRARR